MRARRRPRAARRRLGRRGERVAARHLRRHGLRVLARNVRVGRGEIDIVAREGPTLVIVEVRSRTATAGPRYRALDAGKLRRLRRVARGYLSSIQWRPRSWRVDAIEIRFRRRWWGWSVSDLSWHRSVVAVSLW